MKFIRVCASIAFVCSAFCLTLLGRDLPDVLTFHNDLARTGLNPNETTLTPQTVRSPSFRLLRSLPVDGQVYAQPLYVSSVPVISGGQPKGTHNLLIVATEHDSLYAFDADSGALYWKQSLLGSDEVPADDLSCADLTPENGVTATPVIDRSAGANGRVYVLAMSKPAHSVSYFYRLHALDLTTGQDALTPVTVQASVPGTGPDTDGLGNVIFVAQHERSRAGLLLVGGVLYADFGSFCDISPYTGWVIAYNASTLIQTAAFNTNPNGLPVSTDLPDGSGSGIWQSGAPPAVDINGNLYLATANGPFDTTLDANHFPTNRDYGDSFLKLSPSLQVLDYFTPYNELDLATHDTDVASGGSMVLDVGTNQLAFTAGKNGTLYVFDRNNLGKFDPAQDHNLQQIPGNHGSFSAPAYFNGSLYFSLQSHPLQQLQINGASLNPVPFSVTPTTFEYPGTSPSISSSGTSQGIVWAVERAATTHIAVLHAYDATNLATELYTSAGTAIGTAVKFAVPTVCNGKVFVGTGNSVAVFGLAPPANMVDLNGDGRSDLVFLNAGTGQAAAWLMNGNTALATAVLGAIPANSRLVALTDFANQGRTQLIWSNGSANFLAWSVAWSNAQVPTTTATAFALPRAYPVLIGVDLNGDGLVDAVQYNPATGALLIAKNNGNLAFSTQFSATVDVGWSLLGSADLNGDGSHQLLWRDRRTGAVGAWVMAGFQLSRTMGYGTAALNWVVRGLGRVDGTTAEGLLWQNQSTGQVGLWKLNTNGQVTPTVVGSASLAWQLAANAAVDGPGGLPELLWANPGSGQAGLWRVNGAAVSTVILGNPGAAWTLQPTPQLH